LAADHPWTGVGPSGFKYAYPQYAIAGYVEAAHQNYLQMFAELGVIGGGVFLWLLGAVVFTARRALRRASGYRDRAWAIGGLCSVIVLLVHSFLDYDWYVGAIGVTFWLVAGMLAHHAHAKCVEPLAPAPEKQQRRRGRSRTGSWAAAPHDREARQLPWPRSSSGRAIAFAVFAVILVLCVRVPVQNARSQRAIDLGLAQFMSRTARGQSAGLVSYRRATDYDPGWAKAWQQYGMAQGVLGNIEAGADSIKRAVKQEPTSHRPLKSLASLYKHGGRLQEAVTYYQRSATKFPNNTETLKDLAETYQLMGDGANAIRVYQRIVEIENSPYNLYRALDVDVDTNYAYAHYHLGRAVVLAYEQGTRPDGLQVALSEYGSALRVIQDYFEKAHATDQMFRMLNRPREYRGEKMQRLEARARWRLGDVYRRPGQVDRADGEQAHATALMEDVARATAIEDGVQVE
jgi:tetratricopeptide (TPR) repeat protein